MVKRVLFVCGRNVDRSPTAEDMYKGAEGLEVKSAGTSIGATVPVTKELIEWAGFIFAMEERNKQAILKIDSSSEWKIWVLGIQDIFCRDDPELKQLLRQKLGTFFKSADRSGCFLRVFRKVTFFEGYYVSDYEADYLSKEPEYVGEGKGQEIMREWFRRCLPGLVRKEQDSEPQEVFFEDLMPKEVFRRLSQDLNARFRFRITVETAEI